MDSHGLKYKKVQIAKAILYSFSNKANHKKACRMKKTFIIFLCSWGNWYCHLNCTILPFSPDCEWVNNWLLQSTYRVHEELLSFTMSVIKSTTILLSLMIQFLLYPHLIKGNLFRQIFKEGNFWTPKMQKNSTANTLIECGSYCIADEVMMSRIGLLILKWFCIIS